MNIFYFLKKFRKKSDIEKYLERFNKVFSLQLSMKEFQDLFLCLCYILLCDEGHYSFENFTIKNKNNEWFWNNFKDYKEQKISEKQAYKYTIKYLEELLGRPYKFKWIANANDTYYKGSPDSDFNYKLKFYLDTLHSSEEEFEKEYKNWTLKDNNNFSYFYKNKHIQDYLFTELYDDHPVNWLQKSINALEMPKNIWESAGFYPCLDCYQSGKIKTNYLYFKIIPIDKRHYDNSYPENHPWSSSIEILKYELYYLWINCYSCNGSGKIWVHSKKNKKDFIEQCILSIPEEKWADNDILNDSSCSIYSIQERINFIMQFVQDKTILPPTNKDDMILLYRKLKTANLISEKYFKQTLFQNEGRIIPNNRRF